MLFNSLDFGIFLPIVFSIYWIISSLGIRSQNIFLLGASYFFYGMWDVRFLILIFLSSTIDYIAGIKLETTDAPSKRKLYLFLSLSFNLGMLGIFKYYNFFLENFERTFSFFGLNLHGPHLNIILPVGISFYTFQTLSYTIDVYRKKISSTHDWIAFFSYVAFFPQLVAGPIERARHLIPQFTQKRSFNHQFAIDGLKQIIWGLFKKIVVANLCNNYVNDIFERHAQYSSITLALGAFYFGVQIYCDFSGYSDIAIGTAQLFGFKFMSNFEYPYFSRNISEFWRRWHISLTSWFRDYLYIPLGGSRTTQLKKIRNVWIIFLVSGFWHGANWTFVTWGALNAIYFLPLMLLSRNNAYSDTVSESKTLPNIQEFFQMLLTFSLVTFSWIFFRSENMGKAFSYISKLFSFNFKLDYLGIERYNFEAIPIILLFFVLEWSARLKRHPLQDSKFSLIKTVVIVLLIILLGSFIENSEFIYFQF